MSKAIPIMIQGTHSDAGKSAIVTALCRIFAQDGYLTAPYKSQNMALNSYITIDGKEIGRAQGVQAEAAGVVATTDMNPILIKPTGNYESQIVVHGKVYKNMKAGEYRKSFYDQGIKLIEESFKRLGDKFERIVIEGAGSPAEINLNDRELVNMRVARLTNSPVILVGDIEKGGVFASLVGTLQLLEKEDRHRVIGVIINKFRGDVSLLQPGLSWFEEYTGVPILGVVPYIDNLMIEAEDSVVLSQYTSKEDTSKEIDIAVIRYPFISNFTDIDPFFEEPDCHLRFVRSVEELGNPDILILPGSKNTIEDMIFLHNSGLGNRILELSQEGRFLFGICGGYQMLGNHIEDKMGMESSMQRTDGLGLIPMKTSMKAKKTTTLSEGVVTYKDKEIPVTGYEIHMGESRYERACDSFIRMKENKDGFMSKDSNIIGTYFHGIFHNDLFREVFLNDVRASKGLDPIVERASFSKKREEAFDRLAEVVRENIQLDEIYRKMDEFHKVKG
ncbi:adenosylcobyric acid synthase [Evansella vedderi]|uniref:Cobyric acid synthase n=1 Tax=Evansella vedderi TaxID=38282 RepID=A0ABT9ZYM5_9BACI|nr:cobyric acid synthase [Evansella vedderi]MDQ0256348.1 adenosylcobyric acid synthase [Evansella vedderi]